jgi:hypothetical protein
MVSSLQATGAPAARALTSAVVRGLPAMPQSPLLSSSNQHPGDRAHVLALDGDHGLGQLPDDLLLLLGREHTLDELHVDERHVAPPP